MTDIHDDLNQLQPTLAIRAAVESLSTARTLRTAFQDPYVSLRPADDADIAAFIHPRWLSVALPPEVAAELSKSMNGVEVREKTPATSYVHIKTETVESQPAEVRSLISKALDWRLAGRTLTGKQGGEVTKPRLTSRCPIPGHSYPLSPSGTCICF